MMRSLLRVKLEAKHRQKAQPALSSTRWRWLSSSHFVGTMVAIAIAFDCEPGVIVPFNHKINPEMCDLNLGNYSKAPNGKFVIEGSFERRLAQRPQILNAPLIVGKRRRKMRN